MNRSSLLAISRQQFRNIRSGVKHYKAYVVVMADPLTECNNINLSTTATNEVVLLIQRCVRLQKKMELFL